MATFYEKLSLRWQKSNSLVCVGLDPDLQKLPPGVRSEKYPLFRFNQSIIDSTHEHVCCYKPQIAYYAAQGAENELEMTFEYLNTHYPDIPHILDAKRGDIGSTAAMYAVEAFDRYGADAVTVNPYMGSDTLAPFLSYDSKGVVVLCKTSNPGSDEFQMLQSDQLTLYQRVAHAAQHQWNTHNNILLVVGATYPEHIAAVRTIAPDIPFLVPGVGAQGGDPQAVIKAGLRKDGYGLIINSSRGIIYASMGNDFADAAQKQTIQLKEQINRFRVR